MFTKILIANRGEIACRVAATARRMGIRTVAVYSDADADAKHVAVCDEAVRIGPAAAKESYLLGEKIIEVALACGAQAIHPGYGFLSENSDFAQACAEHGLVFIGPPAAAIRAMGSKSAAKSLMETAHVPLVPGYHGENQDADFLHAQADQIGYPVLLKASAGGGGKGMRVIEQSADFKEALASCKREAINSFGDDKVLAEKYLQRPRHIEIQVFADTHGNCVYLFERDCSVQRRHQKVLEEAPAPGLSEARRRAMGEAAVAAAKAVGYVGAGTVEFIVNQDGSFYFMEMNTRLQVEHPVTEMITATDLVEWQLRVAAGEKLPLLQSELRIHGHAIEARVYAENPEKGFLPSIGTLRHVRTPAAAYFELGNGDGSDPAPIRIDSGVREGDTISPFYDPMLAKLIVWGKDREQALARMAQALAQYQIVGLSSNLAFLSRLIGSTAFATADLDTGLIERNQEQLFPTPPAPACASLALASAALLNSERSGGSDPWQSSQGWRMNSQLQRRLQFSQEQDSHAVQLSYLADGWEFTCDGAKHRLSLVSQQGPELVLRLGASTVSGTVVRDGEYFHVFSQAVHSVFHYLDALAHAGEAEAEGGRLTAPMPGKIVAVLVAAGQSVTKGSALLIMEAMKMEHTISAPHDGIIAEVLYAVGDQVGEGAQLLAFAQPV
ncbi:MULTISPECIES: acetyl/propionyl/methylcrotonyl-CoA carboxylase subunit alpha [unclassified Undibacterium]|uniref:acetyl/propionyl/methylcrotonyl-CoA carboxylase subunit alpha n=1 Tax=unclassified Undibacterium TaxID=2630295 RepID=UPI002AC91745|nr:MULTISPECIES: acetyl/propionyl/methylcrotonyl-CoA carboxylase subunit alpha [unclassified Undibacterium]MEB0138930.1 acetyl/propionyl/methylcrotonyl-CoA carboxylase subunit alpha [Undibacterium sp. CCC2.1]MEB0171739.1 acetyl/propionyl/methylcrotonyl-CoA carboxylase subunit alpha [Undibacterium sp. CCC1.1]MEB0175561.1 acetyl/propionyl/methylcrotonyl-CoA carboxylase subunit alpha [Undibacterium sp. CCC3.4]MEB0214941.1 acetyl/propionyl/methylcrotonyl-CoA carboxylase subunit alpha [Undibacterium